MIDPTILRPRIPRLGTITTGYGETRQARSGRDTVTPRRSDTLVLHTNDEAAADAALAAYGGEIRHDSPTWAFDVVTNRRDLDVVVLRQGVRQHLELWRTAVCARRCDGVTMSLLDGRPTDDPCLCEREMATGKPDRDCSPHTVVPALLDLDVDRLGIWEIRSTSWGTAAAVAGTLSALTLTGITSGSFPAVVAMSDRTVRDASGKVREVTELTLTVAARVDRLAEIAAQAADEIGTTPAALPDGDDGRRFALMTEWSELQPRAHGLGLRERLADDWRQMVGGGREFGELTLDELDAWLVLVRATVADAEEVVAAERAEAEALRAERDAEHAS